MHLPELLLPLVCFPARLLAARVSRHDGAQLGLLRPPPVQLLVSHAWRCLRFSRSGTTALGMHASPHLAAPEQAQHNGAARRTQSPAMQVAAYLLDHGHFSGVPPTALVSCKQDQGLPGLEVGEVKVGSLQAFVGSDSDCEERGPHAFPTAEVHPHTPKLQGGTIPQQQPSRLAG